MNLLYYLDVVFEWRVVDFMYIHIDKNKTFSLLLLYVALINFSNNVSPKYKL